MIPFPPSAGTISSPVSETPSAPPDSRWKFVGEPGGKRKSSDRYFPFASAFT